MSQLSALPFEEYVQQVLAEHKGERVYHFTYNDKDFWLKQPEQLHGVWHFLKPKPKQAFKNEIQSLQYLAEHQAPVPHLEMFGEDFLVLEDGGTVWRIGWGFIFPNNKNVLFYWMRRWHWLHYISKGWCTDVRRFAIFYGVMVKCCLLILK